MKKDEKPWRKKETYFLSNVYYSASITIMTHYIYIHIYMYVYAYMLTTSSHCITILTILWSFPESWGYPKESAFFVDEAIAIQLGYPQFFGRRQEIMMMICLVKSQYYPPKIGISTAKNGIKNSKSYVGQVQRHCLTMFFPELVPALSLFYHLGGCCIHVYKYIYIYIYIHDLCLYIYI